ncbi:hypothetical protein [Corynebacterium aquatimens]|uniref:Uncharacterized protein n=1 Tax=Corynebacterium aquatimens TaxID=1190508 RepID=A0A931DXZ9_9CORY|nr:hypothetical protein [Corynebacterium aquatimens]MBG6121039.1 hypothetical protein [Corynebacterium aquatimens]WJY66404.1 hypothetical protein CAQUA_08555 [Corynebacterium aquatimens]
MAKETAGHVENIREINPAWPANTPGGHPVTELSSKLAGASSPYGDDLILPRPWEETGYVHPTTRINRAQ